MSNNENADRNYMGLNDHIEHNTHVGYAKHIELDNSCKKEKNTLFISHAYTKITSITYICNRELTLRKLVITNLRKVSSLLQI